LWLPVGADDIAVRVLTAEPRYAALSAGHPLADRQEVKFAEIAQYIKPDMDRITTAEKTCPQTTH